MKEDRIQRVVSQDGTAVAGRVWGKGPPLVLLHGGADDGSLSWGGMIPALAERFTCHVPSARGLGPSADHPDHRPERYAEDVCAYVESVGEPVGVVGYSAGGVHALAAVQRGARVSAMALFESPVFELWEEEGEDEARFEQGVSGAFEAGAEGRMTDAARSFVRGVSNDDEMAALEEAGLLEPVGRFVPHLIRFLEQAPNTEAPSPNDPAELARVDVPVLLLYGTRTTTPHRRSMHRLAEGLPKAELREIPGIGHMAPLLEPRPIAEELNGFFEAVLGHARLE